MRLTGAIFDDLWASAMKDKEKNQGELRSKKKLLEEQLESIMVQVIRTTNDTVRVQYEKQIEKLGLQVEELDQRITSVYDYKVPNRTSRETVFNILKNPLSAWQNYNVHQKQRFFSFIFEENLSYSKENGYRTPLYTLPLRIFEQVSASNIREVDIAAKSSNSMRSYVLEWADFFRHNPPALN